MGLVQQAITLRSSYYFSLRCSPGKKAGAASRAAQMCRTNVPHKSAASRAVQMCSLTPHKCAVCMCRTNVQPHVPYKCAVCMCRTNVHHMSAASFVRCAQVAHFVPIISRNLSGQSRFRYLKLSLFAKFSSLSPKGAHSHAVATRCIYGSRCHPAPPGHPRLGLDHPLHQSNRHLQLTNDRAARATGARCRRRRARGSRA